MVPRQQKLEFLNTKRTKLDPETETKVVAEATAKIHRLLKQETEVSSAIGLELLHIKAVLGHNRFGAWISKEFDLSHRTAQNYMAVAKVLGDKSAMVAHLRPTTLYALANRRKCPDRARAEVFKRIAAGEALDDHAVIDIILGGIKEERRHSPTFRRKEAKPEPTYSTLSTAGHANRISQFLRDALQRTAR
ncbi:DUF3102 domain-containing protein [Mesorhizobium sp. M2C.T.Ca.TU.002.02.1.1]|uniref:DUF3102 domain-containing protein n=1 Tax=Mesorhizobium sp. M2C.T.Ca.TU.002.02.1.1 TaxID=2496788 RepID=UPI0013E3FBA7|nr:DUF3102 domain-containing protein [Mesorhizobium sp. M2C.T.Ca.TU.002.02.1.1]